MKFKLSNMLSVSDLVTLDQCEVNCYNVVSVPGVVEFELADETHVNVLYSEIEFIDGINTFELVDIEGVKVVFEFFMRKNTRLSDMMQYFPFYNNPGNLEDQADKKEHQV